MTRTRMTECPACHWTVSPEADRCPKCGHPIGRGFMGRAGTERAFNFGCLGLVILVVAIVMLGMCARL